MTRLGAVTRLRAMDGRELRFRLACEARKAAGRLRFAVSPPRLSRSRITAVLDRSAGPLVQRAVDAARRGDFTRAHLALAQHFASRVSCWPLQAPARRHLVDDLERDFPHAAPEAQRRADRILAGRYDLLGFQDVAAGNPPDWHADVVHGRRAPLAHWTRVPYLDPAIGDHKIIWELNRQQYLLTLGEAYWLTGERRYREAAIAHIESWIGGNPPLAGVNWASMLELAFRAMSWTWAIEFFCHDAEADRTPWLVDLLLSLDRQLTHVQQNLSTYFSPNTHISGEGLALYAVSRALPELGRSEARAAQGREILRTEAARQIRADGGHAELSSHYHRYSTDFYLLALAVARGSGDQAAAAFESAARRQAIFLRTIADDRGNLPGFGDDDGGQLFRFGDEPASNAAVTLGVAAALLDDSSLAVTRPREAEYWILGRRPDRVASRFAPDAWPSRLLADSGYFVSRAADGSHLVFDAGPHGFLNGGHAHADALSIVLSVGGEPLFVDPGTGTYTMDPAARDRFRSSHMHNTLVIGGRDPAVPRGPFHWQTRADARMLVARCGPAIDFAAGTHDGYAPFRHVRAVLAIAGTGWLIVDRVTGPGEIAADAWWHLHPLWHPTVTGDRVDLRGTGGRRFAFASTAAELRVVEHPGGFAPAYGRIERGVAVRASRSARDECVLALFVPVLTGTAAVAVSRLAAPAPERGWVETRFQLQTGDTRHQVRLWFPSGGEAEPGGTWPQPCIEQLVTSCVE
ncbi:MAG TPA: alginate lyase family protein [Vicinamibacterales bacterium]|nr:alginate lyase family protein [Vicinamibacterales bacterium]